MREGNNTSGFRSQPSSLSSDDKESAFVMGQIGTRLNMMKVIHMALVLGVAGFGSFVIFYARQQFSFEISFRNPLVIVSALLSTVTIIVPLLWRMPRVSLPGTQPDIHAVLNRYQVFFLMRASIIEGGALFSGVITLVTHNVVPAVFFLASAVTLALLGPSQHDLISLSSPAGE